MSTEYVERLERLLLEADTVARRRGDHYGLCDCIANDGTPYPSAYADRIIDGIREKYTPPAATTYPRGETDARASTGEGA